MHKPFTFTLCYFVLCIAHLLQNLIHKGAIYRLVKTNIIFKIFEAATIDRFFFIVTKSCYNDLAGLSVSNNMVQEGFVKLVIIITHLGAWLSS